MTRKILITPRSFAKYNQQPIERLVKLGFEVILNPYGRILSRDEMIEQIKEVEGVIIGIDPLDQKVIQHAKSLKVISKYGVGIDNIDLNEAEKRKIPVTTTDNANTNAVAEYTVSLMLAVARKLAYIDRCCRRSDWSKIASIEVSGKTLGIVGLGNIGKQVVQLLSGFNMRVLAYDPYPDLSYAEKHKVSYVSLDVLLEKSDFITLHSPLNSETRHMISEPQFSMMKESAIIVNTARGGLIDQEALLQALQQKRIYGAGIDVFEQEPLQDRRFFDLENIIIGSHCAASTIEAINNMSTMAVDNLLAYL